MRKTAHHTFETPEQLYAWLQANHASESELWVRIYKKATGQPSVTWDDCVVAAIAWVCRRPFLLLCIAIVHPQAPAMEEQHCPASWRHCPSCHCL